MGEMFCLANLKLLASSQCRYVVVRVTTCKERKMQLLGKASLPLKLSSEVDEVRSTSKRAMLSSMTCT